MISLKEFEASILDEIRIIKHLITLVPQDAWDYRASPKQRSMLELAQYLSINPRLGIEVVMSGESSSFKTMMEEAGKLGPEDFQEAFDREAAAITERLATIKEESLQEMTDPFKVGPQRKGNMLLNFVLKNIAAYKMMLFLYVKANGRDDISTMDVWMGMPTPKKE